MIDKQKILDKLRLIKENLVKLKSLKRVPVSRFIDDFEKYDSAKYNLQTAIEAMLDICNHIISRNASGIPNTNADAFRILCQKKILDSDMEETFTAMA